MKRASGVLVREARVSCARRLVPVVSSRGFKSCSSSSSSNHLSFSVPSSSPSVQVRSYSDSSDAFVTHSQEGAVAIVKLNKPKALNSLCSRLVTQLGETLLSLDRDDSVNVIVLTGEGKAFAAGADIKEMGPLDFASIHKTDLFKELNDVLKVRKPIIGAINGFTFGGGCELAMMCDILIASDKAQFGQPEIKLGTMPGIGGSQRLPRAIGKSKAMEWNLTGDFYKAEEAERAGLVSKVVPHDQLMEEALKMANKIAQFSRPVVALIKESVNKAYESSLAEGLAFEKRAFQSTFALEDRKEGMAAFAEKRPANVVHK